MFACVCAYMYEYIYIIQVCIGTYTNNKLIFIDHF